MIGWFKAGGDEALIDTASENNGGIFALILDEEDRRHCGYPPTHAAEALKPSRASCCTAINTLILRVSKASASERRFTGEVAGADSDICIHIVGVGMTDRPH